MLHVIAWQLFISWDNLQRMHKTNEVKEQEVIAWITKKATKKYVYRSVKNMKNHKNILHV